VVTQPTWKSLVLSSGNEDLLYELFHENSKLGRHTQHPAKEEVLDQMKCLHQSLPYEGLPRVDLPPCVSSPNISLFQAMQSRSSIRSFAPSTILLEDLGALLHYSYGVTRKSGEAHRGLRVVPSAGGLYPLELYLYSAHLHGHHPGIFHYNSEHHCLQRLRSGDSTEEIIRTLVQPDVGRQAAVLIFVTALFERCTFKYQDRGYRFALIEAGHIAQNLNLAAIALNYSSINIGGFFDREIDDLLGLDGVTHSTLYIIAIGCTTEHSS
jgi:SagB-type dehydrogenase family enzyme